MAKKILNVVNTAYRATIEEQDDPVLWLVHALKGAGTDQQGVVLRGNAVNYAVKGQDASGLRFGSREQTQPARLDQDVGGLIEKGLEVYLVEEDASDRGLEPHELIGGLKRVSRAKLAELFDQYDQVWSW